MWICKKCDHENSEEAICCSNCGKKRQQRVLNKSLLLDVIAVVGILCIVLAFSQGKSKNTTPTTPGPSTAATHFSTIENKPDINSSNSQDAQNDNRIYVEGYQVLASFPEDNIYVMGYGDGTTESGDHMLLCRGDQRYRFEFGWYTRYGIEFFEKVDVDSDAITEYALCIDSIVGSGTNIESLIVFDPLPDGSFQAVCFDKEDVQKLIREICVAGRLGEDYILIREEIDDGQIFKRVPSEKDAGDDGVRIEYEVKDGGIKASISMQFEYSIYDQCYLFVCDPWDIFDDDPETVTIHVDNRYCINADVLCDSIGIGLGNIEIPGSYVDPSSLI